MRRWWRRLFASSGPRFCDTCSQPLSYSILVEFNKRTGSPKGWHWAAACPESSILFDGARGGWSGNGNAYRHALYPRTGIPVWASPMQRAMVMRRALRRTYLSGYGERLHIG